VGVQAGFPTGWARRGRRWTPLLALVAVCTACAPTAPPSATPTPTTAPTSTPTPTPIPTPVPTPTPNPYPGQAAGLPAVPAGVPFTGHLMISDEGNDRLLIIDAQGNVSWVFPAPGQTLPVPFGEPDDAFLTPDGNTVIANAEGSQTVTAINRTTGTVLWQVGHNNVRGHTTGYFSEPDDAVPYPDGTFWIADIRNCRLVHLGPGGEWLGTLGSGSCTHHPPASFAEPNGAFPAPDGSMIVTEIWGGWITWINPDGTVKWSVRGPAAYPSDALPYPDGSVLLTDYESPGAVYRISPTGQVLWSYRPTSGPGELNHTSIAMPVASNRIAICDDWDNRIIILDPTTNTIVWTYTGPASKPLNTPDGLDYIPY
jgi:outer membrane protein assembly factor BamB